MKNTKITLVPLTADDREQFILNNQWAFKCGALYVFGERDNHIDDDGEIISRKTIERCIDNPQNETYRIVLDDRYVGSVILKINKKTNVNELEILFVSPEDHTKGIGYGAWLAIETCTPKRKFGRPAHLILKNETYIFTLINVVLRLMSFGVNTLSPHTICPTMKNRTTSKVLTKCSIL